MKHIIIEGGDSLGKNTIIEALCEYFNYDNIAIRHFGRPPTNLSPKATLDFQFNTFHKEASFVNFIEENIDNDEFEYFNNIIIWNRSHLGEYVYSTMFRGITKKDVLMQLVKYEKTNFYNKDNTYLITLSASPKFFLSQEDGYSFSKNIKQKTEELKLFKEIHILSSIKNKKLIKVNKELKFRDKNKIFKEIIEFINN